MLDRFADRLAASAGQRHDGDVAAVGRRLGLEREEAAKMMQHLRRRMGDQAR